MPMDGVPPAFFCAHVRCEAELEDDKVKGTALCSPAGDREFAARHGKSRGSHGGGQEVL